MAALTVDKHDDDLKPVQNNVAPPAYMHTDVRGRFNQYTSGFWALALPGLMARYVARSALHLTEKMGKISESTQAKWYNISGGLLMGGITALYATRTYADVKRVFAETVAYETGKQPEEIGWSDLTHSKNAIVHRTMQNLKKYNFRRSLVTGSFFATLLPFKPFNIKGVDTVDFGVGATGAYLMSDVISRKITFFEALQLFIDQKINHSDAVGQPITESDLMNLYAIHSRDNDPAGFVPDRMDTIGWNNDRVLFGRMADLMNQTYRNVPNKEGADFTIPKLLYLLGNGLLTRDDKEESMAYIEIANKYGIKAVKEIEHRVKQGVEFEKAAEAFPVKLLKAHDIPLTPTRQKPVEGHVERLIEKKVKEEVRSEQRSM